MRDPPTGLRLTPTSATTSMSRADAAPRKVSAAFPGVSVTTPRAPSTVKALPRTRPCTAHVAVPHDPLTTRLKESARTAVAVTRGRCEDHGGEDRDRHQDRYAPHDTSRGPGGPAPAPGHSSHRTLALRGGAESRRSRSCSVRRVAVDARRKDRGRWCPKTRSPQGMAV